MKHLPAPVLLLVALALAPAESDPPVRRRAVRVRETAPALAPVPAAPTTSARVDRTESGRSPRRVKIRAVVLDAATGALVTDGATLAVSRFGTFG